MGVGSRLKAWSCLIGAKLQRITSIDIQFKYSGKCLWGWFLMITEVNSKMLQHLNINLLNNEYSFEHPSKEESSF